MSCVYTRIKHWAVINSCVFIFEGLFGRVNSTIQNNRELSLNCVVDLTNT